MDEKSIAIIKNVLEELVKKMGFSGEIIVSQDIQDDSIICDLITGTDSNLLIGQHGVNLQALQHLARLVVRKNIPEKLHFTLDINSYRKQKNLSITQQAQQAAREAIDQKRCVSMQPMTTYERRLVHMELSKNSEVVTESVGEGENRKIIVKPANMFE